MNKQIILHVGAHKTGTTYLQRDVFPHLENVYFAKDGVLQEKVLRLANSKPDNPNFDEEKQAIYDFIAEREEPIIFISYEGFFGHYQRSYHNNTKVAENLHRIFPNAQLLVVFRKQDDWLESLYHQTIHNGYSYRIHQFLNYSRGEYAAYDHKLSYEGTFDVRFNFFPFIENYRSLFGSENVLALPYEFFKKDINGFLDRIYEFTGITTFYPEKTRPINRSFSWLSCHIALRLNKLIRDPEQQAKFRYFLKKELDTRIYIPPVFINKKQRAQIMSMHHDKNRQLGDLVGMDLGQYGYY